MKPPRWWPLFGVAMLLLARVIQTWRSWSSSCRTAQAVCASASSWLAAVSPLQAGYISSNGSIPQEPLLLQAVWSRRTASVSAFRIPCWRCSTVLRALFAPVRSGDLYRFMPSLKASPLNACGKRLQECCRACVAAAILCPRDGVMSFLCPGLSMHFS